MAEINVTLSDGRCIQIQSGTRVGKLIKEVKAEALPYIAAVVNNEIASLSYPLSVNCSVKFITMADSHGWRVYRHSLCFLLAKAIREVFPEASFRVEHSFGLGLFCNFQLNHEDNGISAGQLAKIEEHMKEIVKKNLPIERKKTGYTEAVSVFEQTGQTDKLNLLKYRNPPHVITYYCDGFSDLAHGPLVPSTGVLSRFKLIHYPPGFVLHLPDKTDPEIIPPFEDQPQLFQIFKEHKEWGQILGVTNVGKLNEIISKGGMADFIRVNESLHEKKIADIADRLTSSGKDIKIILIAGPSSSGKTTFAKRLAIQLKVNGLRPETLSTDDFFVGIEKNPIGPDGKPDYEHIEAVDIPLFNKTLLDLINGKEVELPRFNFSRKAQEFNGDKMRIEKDQIIIIEGIHGLNPRLTGLVPSSKKFKIYISALTQLSVDSNNRISTTDNRLIRRIIRDNMFRGHSALHTLQLWPSVRNGEKTWIFPFQREADATFNSALDYELAVLKQMVEPLLMQIKPDNEEYAEARRLSAFLLNFLPSDAANVPGTSILREYIGGSNFKY